MLGFFGCPTTMLTLSQIRWLSKLLVGISIVNTIINSRHAAVVDPPSLPTKCRDIHRGIFPFVREDFPGIVNTWRREGEMLNWKPVDILKIVSCLCRIN